MNIPLLDFSVLWRGQRCPRQLREYLNSSPHFNPRLAVPADLERPWAAVLSPPDSDQTEYLDHVFGIEQDRAVAEVLRRWLPGPADVGGETLWEIEGESLRDIGWLAAGAGERRHPQVHQDNWRQVLNKLPGVHAPGFVERFLWCRPNYLFMDGPDTWILVLAKAGSRVRDAYVAEAGFIRDILARKGIRVVSCLLMCLDEAYIRPAGGEEPGPEAFRLHSLNQAVKHQPMAFIDRIPGIVESARAGQACENARTCRFCADAAPSEPRHSIYTLHRGGKAVDLLERQGITAIADIDKADARARGELKDRHFIQIKAVRQNRPHVDAAGLKQFLGGIRYPVLCIDFESTSQALPPAAGIRTWEHVPFLCALRRVADPAAVEPDTAVTVLIAPDEPVDEGLRRMAAAIAEVGRDCGSIIAYGGALEASCLARLAELAPDLSGELRRLRSGMVDLQWPFQQFLYYHPDQLGKLSLKRVLPLLTAVDHGSLQLRDGAAANLTYYFLAHPEARRPDMRGFDAPAARLRELEEYCAMDTDGLVQLLSALYALAV